MNQLLYYLVVKPLSLLPFPILYLVSDILRFFVWNVFGYRKKVVITNIERSFPEKTDQEVLKIAKGFYKHFCDIIVESVKGFSITKKQLDKRVTLEDDTLWKRLHAEGKHVIYAGGHYGNWEMTAVAFGYQLPHKLVGIYKRLNNKFWDHKMRSSRSKYGTEMIPTFTTAEVMDNLKEPSAVAFLYDQSPRDPKKGYWSMFLNQETATLRGVEKYAKKYNYPVVFSVIDKVSRGKFSVGSTLVCEDPSGMRDGEILQRINALLETQIRKKPELWLWSHKRWKHKRPEDMQLHEAMEWNREEAVG